MGKQGNSSARICCDDNLSGCSRMASHAALPCLIAFSGLGKVL